MRPASIPDYLALTGDSADGYPGLRGWGAKSSAAVFAKFLHLEAIPADASDWHVDVANAGALATTLAPERWRRCGAMFLCSTTSRSCGGTAPRRSLAVWRRGSMRR